MIQLVAPWLVKKYLVRLDSREEFSLHDSVLTCLYCKYRYFSDIDKQSFIYNIRQELDELPSAKNDFETLCYYFEINICVVEVSVTTTRLIDYHECVYNNKPTIIIEKNKHRYYPVGVLDPYCGTQVVFYPDNPDDQYIIDNIKNDKSSVKIEHVIFEDHITEFSAKDMFKAHRN
jgi:hypothetical protein